jgi:hypothetical protein
VKTALGLCVVLMVSIAASGAETISSVNGSGVTTAGDTDFSREVSCAASLAESELVGTHGFHVVEKKGILLSGQREGRAGFYTFSTKGASFSELGSLKPTSENFRFRTYKAQIQFPGGKDKTSVVYKQLVEGSGEAGIEFKESGGEPLASDEASDLFAEKALVTRLNESIASMPKTVPGLGSTMFPTLLNDRRDKTRTALSKIICGCKGVEGTKEALAKMRATPQVKIYDVKFPCE